MKKEIGKIFIILGIINFVISLAIYLDINIKDEKYKKENDNVLKKIDKIIDDPSSDEKIVEIEGKNYIGIISIPSLNVTLPIQEEWTTEKARSSPAIYKGFINDYPLIIGGHNNNSQFRKLYKVTEGTEIILIKLNGEKYVYRVKEIETIDGKDITKMIDTDYPLTLFTCTFSNKSRLTIRCI